MKRRQVSPFSLSFLDIMFCGFGAVVLLVLILNTDTVRARNQVFEDLRSEVVLLEEQVLSGEKGLLRARNSLESTERELVVTQGETERVIRTIDSLQQEISTLQADTRARRQHIAGLTSDLKQLETQKSRYGDEPEIESGAQVRRITADGDRQYLTGLKVGGKRILILLDASASMLDETIINIIRRRNMPVAKKRSAPKWRRAQATTEWLLSQLPPDADFQVYVFNTQARPAVKSSGGSWLSAKDAKDLEAVVTAVRETVPQKGTNLYRTFAVSRKLSPKPDNILLITDGLPTQGKSKPGGSTVSAEQRLKYFDQAVKNLPGRIPVNTILLPMEGDAYAAAAFWRLAVDTRGAFLTPSRDWP